MRKTYGNTWWGKQWLNALKHIDYSNRLPRGKSYANKGAVTKILLEENQISAKVQGTRRTPYKVGIYIPRFKAHEKADILSTVTSNPLFLSQLLNRQLPSELYDLCHKQGIDIFPKSWNDLKGTCSCPDWAVPCKHMAAVLYLVANEIDKDPFRVFDLHDFDLLKALEGIGFSVATDKEVPIPLAENLIEPLNTVEYDPSDQLNHIQQLDFTQIPHCSEDFITLLEKNPVFYPYGDFANVIQKAYKQLSKGAASQEKKSQAIEKEMLLAHIETETIELRVDEFGAFLQAQLRDEKGALIEEFDQLEALTNWLNHIPPGRIGEISPDLRALWLAYVFANKLAMQSACIPQLLRIDSKRYRVRWIAATLQQTVRQEVEIMTEVVPPGLVVYTIGKRMRQPIREDYLHSLLSVFLNHLVAEHTNINFRWEKQLIEELFFRSKATLFDTFENQSYPEAIQLWLNKFYLTDKKYAPILQIEDLDDAFEVRLGIEDTDEPLKIPMGLAELFEDKQYQAVRISVLRDLAMLADYFPQLSQLIASKGAERLMFGSVEFVDILFKIIPIIRLFGIKILLPKGLRKLLRPQLSLSLESEGNVTTSSLLSLENMLRFNWMIAIGDQVVSKEEFLKMLKNYSGIVRLQDQYVYFDEKEIESLIDKLTTPPQLGKHELLQAALTESYEGAKVVLDKKARKLIDDLLKGEGTELPKRLQAVLRPYQLRGFEWLYKNSRIGFGSVIADDMGLGKTLQVISTLLKLKEDGELDKRKALVIVPTTLLTNWEKEIRKFAPDLVSHMYHGSNRNIEPLKEADVLLTTYGIVRSETSKLQKHNWLAVVIDEAQHIKNPSTAQTKAVKKIKAPVKVAMSGTPVENRLSEYWSIFDFANQGYLGKLSGFMKQYAKPIELDRDQDKLDHFRKITAPFILRRLKSDKSIIQDLPDKIEQDQFCELTSEQAALYQNVLDSTLHQVEGAEGINRQGLVLKLMTALKQVCNHPRQFLKKGEAGSELSGKSKRLISLVEELLEQGDKGIIFTQYQQMGDILMGMLEQHFGLQVPFLHGGVSRKLRDEMVEDFQHHRATKLMLLSLKAGGTGLNLTAASHVIHYDLWWNPAVEAQATDRAYRIGQHKNVQVHRFITQGTFEEKINEMLKRKKELADLTVATGEKWVGDLSNKELKELVTLSPLP